MRKFPLRHVAAEIPLRAPAPRRIVSLSPLAATGLLTAAIFLLPATSDQRPAQASVDGRVKVATQVQFEKASQVSTLRH